jgi:hypothetical protein
MDAMKQKKVTTSQELEDSGPPMKDLGDMREWVALSEDKVEWHYAWDAGANTGNQAVSTVHIGKPTEQELDKLRHKARLCLRVKQHGEFKL